MHQIRRARKPDAAKALAFLGGLPKYLNKEGKRTYELYQQHALIPFIYTRGERGWKGAISGLL